MFSQYFPAVFLALLAATFAAAVIFVSHLLGEPARRKGPRTFPGPYECGIDQRSDVRGAVPVKFFLVALLFLLFDVELALLYPWAALYRTFLSEGMGGFMFVEGAVFIGVLSLGLIYIFRRGALK